MTHKEVLKSTRKALNLVKRNINKVFSDEILLNGILKARETGVEYRLENGKWNFELLRALGEK